MKLNLYPQEVLRRLDIIISRFSSFIGFQNTTFSSTGKLDIEALRLNGYLFIKDFFSKQHLSLLKNDTSLVRFYECLHSLGRSNNFKALRPSDLSRAECSCDASWLKLVNFTRVDFRGAKSKVDENMIDLFFKRRFALDETDRKINGGEFVLRMDELHEISFHILEPFFSSIGYKYSHSNLYLYKGVMRPRCLHIDSFVTHFKAMIILKELTHSSGPYSYVPQSHRFYLRKSFAIILNKIFGSSLGNHKYDMTTFSSINAKRFIAQDGSLIITNQSGIHGDFPAQLDDNDKYSLVLNFTKK